MTAVKDIVDRLESEFQKEGAQIEQVQKMDKRPVFLCRRATSTPAYFVNFIFHADSQSDHQTALEVQARPGGLSPALPAAAREKGEAGEKEDGRDRSSLAKNRGMASYNKVFLLGNLTRDPKSATHPRAARSLILGIAVNRQYTLDTGEKREEVTFVDVTFWGRTAEVAGEYLKKGRSVFIEGRLQLDTWDDKQSGQKRSKLKVIGEMMQMLGGRPGGGGGGGEEGVAKSRRVAPRDRAALARAARRLQRRLARAGRRRDSVLGLGARSSRLTKVLLSFGCDPMNSTEACIALNMVAQMGPVRLRKLLEVFETPERILAAKRSELRSIDGIGNEVAEQIANWEKHGRSFRVNSSGSASSARR